MNRIIIMLASVVALYWVWALSGEDHTKHADSAPTVEKAASLHAPMAARPKGKGDESVDQLDVDPAVLRIVYQLASAEKRCKRNIRTACVQLETKDFAGKRQLAAMRNNLAKACEKQVVAACFARGEIEFNAGDRRQAMRWYGNVKRKLEAVQLRCKAGREPNRNSCHDATSTLATLKLREKVLTDLAH